MDRPPVHDKGRAGASSGETRMAEATSAIPVGVYPYLTVKGGKAAIDFYS
jgi:hypothetical protein